MNIPSRSVSTATLGALALVVLVAGCSQAPASSSAPVTTTVAATTAAAATTETQAHPPPAAPSSWTMPNLVGTGLQDAQDAIQKLTNYGIPVTTSHDAGGADRMQVLDRDWKVCTQNVRPGAEIKSDTRIDFGAVKLSESC